MTKQQNVKSCNNITTNAHEKDKDFLTEGEVGQLLKAAKNTRYSIRNQLLITMMYKHGLRVSEVINIKLSDLNLNTSRIWIRRLKGGLSVEHPIPGEELRLIRKYLRLRENNLPWLFINERNLPLTRQAVNYIIFSVSNKAGIENVSPHTLRHSCGYYLANKGYQQRIIQDYLGHRDPKHTALYTRISGKMFDGIW
jgi:integrase